MEADWEFEVGGNAPAIDACWPGFVDLRTDPERVWELPEVREAPALASALRLLNAPASRVWTSKCDFWPVLQPEDFDAWELDAPLDSFDLAIGCYIDVLARNTHEWCETALVEAECKRLCSLLAAVPQRCCRIDLVVRRVVANTDGLELGFTAYITACGSNRDEAEQTFASALGAFARVLPPSSKVQWENTGE